MKYEQYYNQQGNGVPYPVFRGRATMKGHGFGFLGRIAKRFSKPLFNWLMPKILKTGRDVADDLIEKKRNLKDSLKHNAMNTVKETFFESLPAIHDKLTQSGQGLAINDFEPPGDSFMKSHSLINKSNLQFYDKKSKNKKKTLGKSTSKIKSFVDKSLKRKVKNKKVKKASKSKSINQKYKLFL